MAKTPMTEDLKRLHMKFKPANIAIAVISVIVAICLFFMPWFDLHITVRGDKLGPLVESFTDEIEDSVGGQLGSDFGSDGEEAVKGATAEMVDVIIETLADVKLDIPVNINARKMLMAATGSDKELGDFFNSLLGAKGVTALFNDLVEKLTPPIITAGITIAITQMQDQINALPPEIQENLGEYKDSVAEIVTDLVQGNTDEAKAELITTAKGIATDFDFPETVLEDPELDLLLNDAVDMIIAWGEDENGEFAITNIIDDIENKIDDFDELMPRFEAFAEKHGDTFKQWAEENADKFEGLMGDGESDDSSLATASRTVRASALNDSSLDSSDSSEEEDNPLTMVTEILKDPGAYIIKMIADGEDPAETEKAFETIRLALLIAWIWIVGIPMFFWLLLALNAFIRIFTTKKRVRWWYVKLICFWSGFGVLLGNLSIWLAPKILANSTFINLIGTDLLAETPALGAVFEAIGIKFLGSGIVAGIAWLILDFGYFFWYRRTKKKIKRYVKAQKRYAKAQKRALKRGEPAPAMPEILIPKAVAPEVTEMPVNVYLPEEPVETAPVVEEPVFEAPVTEEVEAAPVVEEIATEEVAQVEETSDEE